MTKKKVFYGWWIVVGGFILNFIGIGIGINAIGVFFKPVVESLSFSRGDFSLYFTIAALSMTFTAPVVGKLMEKFDVRLIMGFSTMLLAVSFALYSQCTTLLHFYLLSILVGIGHGRSHIIPVSTMISNWFKEKRGLAMGIVFSGTGLGGLLFNPLSNWLILEYGWRQTYILLGIIIGIACIPTAVFLMRISPEQVGLNPDGIERKDAPEEKAISVGLTLGEFIKTGAFWFLAFMVLFINMLNMGIQQHLIPYLTDLKHSSTFAANIMGLYLGMTVVGKLTLGQISDTRGLAKSLILFLAILVIGILMLFDARLALFAILFAVIYGIGNAVQTVLPPLMTSECSGLKHFALIYGIISIFSTLGSAVGMPLSGYLYDWQGNYDFAFVLYIALAIIAAVLGVCALRSAPFRRSRALDGL
jgi:MFS family permease